MARPGKVYKRRTMPGIDLPISWKPPACAIDWLAERLTVDRGHAEQRAAHQWAVWQVWRHESIGVERVMLLCSVERRQALYLMDYAAALDRYMLGLFDAGAALPLMALPDGCREHKRGYLWDKWAELADVERGMPISADSVKRLTKMITK